MVCSCHDSVKTGQGIRLQPSSLKMKAGRGATPQAWSHLLDIWLGPGSRALLLSCPAAAPPRPPGCSPLHPAPAEASELTEWGGAGGGGGRVAVHTGKALRLWQMFFKFIILEK